MSVKNYISALAGQKEFGNVVKTQLEPPEVLRHSSMFQETAKNNSAAKLYMMPKIHLKTCLCLSCSELFLVKMVCRKC